MRRLILVLTSNVCCLAVFDFLSGYLVVNACYLVVTGCYCSLLVVTARSHFQYERSVSHVIKLQEALIYVIVGELETLKQNLSFSGKTTSLGLPTTYLFQTVFKDYKRRYFECILDKPFPSFLLLHKISKLH